MIGELAASQMPISDAMVLSSASITSRSGVSAPFHGPSIRLSSILSVASSPALSPSVSVAFASETSGRSRSTSASPAAVSRSE
jgi:hypothetical protein